MKLSKVGEFGLIKKFLRLSPTSKKVILGIGDDAAAVLPSNKKELLLLTCDPLIEGIHFDHKATAYQIGWKALARNLSDIAAMGGVPSYALVAASLPPKINLSKALGIYRGLAAAAKKYRAVIVGGDTSRSLGGIHLTVTVIGEVAKQQLITRSGAKPGNVLCVTGSLGASILGKHLCFQPRLAEAQFLAKMFRPSAMIDMSDGLASDLRRLAEQSRVGFEIWGDQLPISHALRAQKLSRNQEILHAMQDGEDYELLFTLPPERFKTLRTEWEKRFRLRLTQIGVVHPKRFGIRFIKNKGDKKTRISPRPANDHFLPKFSSVK